MRQLLRSPTFWILVAVILGGTFVRLFKLGNCWLWIDEITVTWAARTTRSPWGIVEFIYENCFRQGETGERPLTFRVYRHFSAFSDLSAATLVEEGLLDLSYFDDGVQDGQWYYGVVGVDAAGNISPISNLMAVVYDSTPPSFTLGFSRVPPVGVGSLGVALTVSEPLISTPTLMVTPPTQ